MQNRKENHSRQKLLKSNTKKENFKKNQQRDSELL